MLLLAAVILSGTWDATVTFDDRTVPFQIEFASNGQAVEAAIVDGPQRHRSTSGKFDGTTLKVHWDYLDSVLTAQFAGGALKGEYVRRTRAGRIPRPFEARPAVMWAPSEAKANVAGSYVMKTDSKGGRRAMEAVFTQKGSAVEGTIQAVDGDFGYLTGYVAGSHVVLTHFDGVRATLVEADYDPKSCLLTGLIDKHTHFEASNASCGGPAVAEAIDPRKYTSVKDPAEAFQFAFPDLDGRPVSLADERFRNKVILVSIMGSWCPNCHDEAPFFEELYKKYNAQGFEVISLAFEYTGEVERDREQVRRFRNLHGLTYTMLLAGTTDQVAAKLPQLKDFGAFPTTLILDRSHRVRMVEAGFAGPANQAEHEKLRHDFEETIRGLLGN